ncbi:Uma2 family endonuclease [Streptomyces gamaensis]|uniref:Uma2 family endonuclease n=1 Tax=Streptomyces gamaensis TaxID=1763542 RepID=A0ABW0Z0G7_9ACTN
MITQLAPHAADFGTSPMERAWPREAVCSVPRVPGHIIEAAGSERRRDVARAQEGSPPVDPRHFELLEAARRALPEGFKTELSGDIIVMQASPSAMHQLNLSKVRQQFDAHVPPGYIDSGNTDLESPQTAKVRNPDLTYLPEEAMATTESSVPAELALIAVEIVSPSNPENDWVGKLRDYPLMGIPLYLIVDARQKVVTLFNEPENGRYRLREDAAFGETVHIPEPFGFALDTGVFRPY